MTADRNLHEGDTRRQFLRRAGLTTFTLGGGSVLLAACGGDDEAAVKTMTSTGPAAAPSASGRIDFLSFEAYDLPDPLKAWKAKNGVSVKPTYVGGQDEVQTKLKAVGSSAGYDIVTYNQGFKSLYRELDILEPLDEQKLPNLKHLFPYFAGDNGNFWVDADGTRTGVPFTWGLNSMIVDTRRVTKTPTSWHDLLEPEFKGRVAIVDIPTDSWGVAAHVLGFTPSQVTKQDGEQVFDLLAQIVAQSSGVSPSFGDATSKMTSGDADVCWAGWAGMNELAAAAGVTSFESVVPKEGSVSFCDAFALPKGADNVDTALAWMNESLDPKVNADAAVSLVAGVTVKGALRHLPKTLRELYAYDDLEGLLEQAPLNDNPPVESDEFVTIEEVQRGWQEIKAGARS